MRWRERTKKTPGQSHGGGKIAHDDALLLEVLHRVDGLGLSTAEAGAPFGLSRAAVCGLVKRIRDDLAQSERNSSVTRAENLDGAMGPGWWRAGLRRRQGGLAA